jgi:HPt (histidine-containing phosphotransfer) domain-containing protein
VRSLPIIALTANAIVGMKEMFLEKGFDDYLSKPISWHRLDEILVKWIPPEKQQPRTALEEDQGINHGDAGLSGEEQWGEALSAAGVNVEQGLSMTGGSLGVYQEVLTVFCRDAERQLETLQAPAAEAEDIHFFTIQVHALKSASASIGAAGLSQKAAALEDAGRRADLKTIGALFDGFKSELRALAEAIRKSGAFDYGAEGLPRDPNEAAGDLKTGPGEPGTGGVLVESWEVPPEVREEVERLRQALQGEEYIAIDKHLAKLQKMELNPWLRQALSSLSECILLLDFPRALTVLDKLPLK